jgi:hypothetical protein
MDKVQKPISSKFSYLRHYLEVSGQIHTPAALSKEEAPPVVGWASELVLDGMDKSDFYSRGTKFQS